MRWMLLGASLAWAALCAAALIGDWGTTRQWLSAPGGGWWAFPVVTLGVLTGSLMVVPIVTMWTGAWLEQRRSPRRLLTRAKRYGDGRWTCVALGLVAGCAAAGVSAVAIALTEVVPAALVAAWMGYMSGTLTLRALPRMRAGECAGCGYPVEEMAVCPECGVAA